MIDSNLVAVCGSAAIGAGTVIWTFSFWLRDRSIEFMKRQISELAEQLNLASSNRKIVVDRDMDALRRRLDTVVAERDYEIKRSDELFVRLVALTKVVEDNGKIQNNEKPCH